MVYKLEMQCTPAKVGLPFSYVSFQSIWSSLPKESILIWRKRIPIISLLLWGKYNSQSFRQTPPVYCSCGHVEDCQAFTCRRNRSPLQFCLLVVVSWLSHIEVNTSEIHTLPAPQAKQKSLEDRTLLLCLSPGWKKTSRSVQGT